MTNAPVILNLDCDMYSNDPTTPLQASCFLSEPVKGLELAYVQFPRRFCGINENDTYGIAQSTLRKPFAERRELDPDHVVGKGVTSETVFSIYD
ncbi:hypothetical protein Syun_019003 [Stephania yunnanensis]|uniref:Cellulose synthase n=1 Tax=Stephania yunnanensis TaxID=152371 RepID=A0AAP0ITB6_9MAGN